MPKKRKPSARRTPALPAQAESYSPPRNVDSRFLLLALRATGFLLLLLSAAAYWRSDWRLWGVNSFAHLSDTAMAALGITVILLLLPLGGRLLRWLADVFAKLPRANALLWGLLAVAVFWSLRISVPLLGDGELWIKELSWTGEFLTRRQPVPQGRIWARKEPLELALHEYVFRASLKLNPEVIPVGLSLDAAEQASRARENRLHDRAKQVYVWLSAIAGGLFVWLSLQFARKSLPPGGRALFLLPIFSAAAMMVFFGYVENYAWTSLALLAFLILSVTELRSRRFPWKAILAFAVAAACHFVSLIFAPAILFLLWQWWADRKKETANPRFALRRASVVVGAVFLIALLQYLRVHGWKGWFVVLPLLPRWSRDGYSLFSMSHAVDFLNILIFAVPAVIVVLLFLRFKGGSARESAIGTFLALTAGCGAAFAFLFSPNLGMARDSDIFAVALWPAVFFAAWRLAHADTGEGRWNLSAALLSIALVTSAPFVLVNHSEDITICRFESLLRMDRARAAYGWESLALHYERSHDVPRILRAWKEAVAIEPSARYKINYATALRLTGRLDEAEPLVVSACKEKPEYAFQLLYIAAAYAQQHRLEKARELTQLCRQLDPKNENAKRLMERIDQAESMRLPNAPLQAAP